MTDMTYAVLRCGDEWRIVCKRRRIGHFFTRREAVDTAAALAREAVSSGIAVELLIQEPTGELRGEKFFPAERLVASGPA